MDVGNVDDEEAGKHRYDDREAEGEGRPRLDERQLVGTKEEVNDVLSDERLDEEKLREEYSPKVDGRLERAKKFDRQCKLPPLILTYALGIGGSLILGVGMCLAMGILLVGSFAMGLGIVAGFISIVLIAVNYPLYQKFLARRKEKFAASILLALNEKN